MMDGSARCRNRADFHDDNGYDKHNEEHVDGLFKTFDVRE
jgi:hypothetical protein